MSTKGIIRIIGIDVHSQTYFNQYLQAPVGIIHGECTVEAEPKNVIRYVNRLKREISFQVSIEVGYEAGPT